MYVGHVAHWYLFSLDQLSYKSWCEWTNGYQRKQALLRSASPLLQLLMSISLKILYVPKSIAAAWWYKEPNMDVCLVNRAVYGNFDVWLSPSPEGACDKVPKTLRTFENFWQPNFPLVHRGILRASLFDLNLHYTIFKLFLSQCSTIFLGSPFRASADSTLLFRHIFFFLI